MIQRGIFPEISKEAISKYWKHMKACKSPIGDMSTGDHLPVYVWGDGAQYTESGESIMVFSCGIVVDEKRTNIFPLFMCRAVT